MKGKKVEKINYTEVIVRELVHGQIRERLLTEDGTLIVVDKLNSLIDAFNSHLESCGKEKE